MSKEIEIDETENFITTTSDAPVVEPEEAKAPEAKNEDDKKPEPAKEPESKPEGKEEEKEVTSKDDAASDDATAEQTKKKGGVQKRVDKLVREREDEKRKNESLAKENKELQERLNAKKPETKSEEPKEGDFDTYDEYLDALDKHENKSSSTERKPEAQKKPEKESTDTEEDQLSDAQRTALAVIQEKVQDAADQFSDFDEVALAKDVDITGDMLEALAECEDPAKVMYHLGQNKSLATEIAAMTPAQQMRQITTLDMVTKVTPPKPNKQTGASDPINPVGGSDVQEKSIGDMSFKEYEESQNKREQSRREGAW